MTGERRITVIGARGQLGTDLVPVLAGEVVALGHEEIDITQIESVEAALNDSQPDVVINCAAYNLVDQAEDEPEIAYQVNALGPRNLAKYCGERDIALLHVSTDYVFGLNESLEGGFTEQDSPVPTSAYGVSKLAGEHFVRGLCRKHFVVRTCGLYGNTGTSGKGNFVKTMVRLGAERDQLSVVQDQRCTPTYTPDLSLAIAALIETDQFGLYHATNSGATTWFDLACEVFRLASLDVEVRPITTAEFGAKAARPAFSVLNCDRLSQVIGRSMPTWQDAVARYVTELTA